MIKVSEKAFSQLCHSYDIKGENLSFLGGGREDSDGIAYVYDNKGQKKVLKILAFHKPCTKELTAMDERLKFIQYLGEGGIDIAYPEENENHRLYEIYEDETHIFLAYSMRFCEGKSPDASMLSTKLSWHWGKLMGKAHRLAKSYPIWSNINGQTASFGHQDEIRFFTNWCKEESVKEEWHKMETALSKLPVNRDTYGFIHNDNHMNNIIVKDHHLTLIDFDVSSCNFFLQDITVPAQGIMFNHSGGMVNEVYNKEPLKLYFDNFINGYETENHLEDFWLKQIDVFINYRRLILFTCMQDYINQNMELKKNYLAMIESKPEIFRLL
jgi:Ser/Thr protein kinase RdoA (MazF antagonist)